MSIRQLTITSFFNRKIAGGTVHEHARYSLVEIQMGKNETTGKKAGSAASKVLRSGSTGKNSKTAAGSALTQRPDKKKK